jgi:hypothetical protein
LALENVFSKKEIKIKYLGTMFDVEHVNGKADISSNSRFMQSDLWAFGFPPASSRGRNSFLDLLVDKDANPDLKRIDNPSKSDKKC